MKPHEFFLPEIGQIQNQQIQNLVLDVLKDLEKANLYFYKAPASRTGKWHPSCCNVQSGLLRHVKRALCIGKHLCGAYGLSTRSTDIVIAALILHDVWKNDFKKHASRACEYITEIIYNNVDRYGQAGATTLAEIIKAIKFHMGLWTEPAFKKPISEYSLIELVVYTADNISSRSDIIMAEDTCELPTEFPGEDFIKGAA